MARKKETTVASKKSVNPGIKKLKLLVTIVNRSKATYYVDLLEQFEVNVQMILYGKGTATSEMLSLLGIAEQDKGIILSYIKEERVKDALETLNEKFHKVKNGKGISFTIPLDSIIGVSMYQLLSNDRTMNEGGKK